MTGTEAAVMHGYARVTVKGYGEKRDAALRRGPVSARPSKPSGDWARQLAADFGGNLSRIATMDPGPSPDGPRAMQ